VLSKARAVIKLKITPEAASDIKRISTATWLWIIQQLAGEPLFPSLQELYIEELDSIIQYLSLFIYSSVKLIHINPPKFSSANKSTSNTAAESESLQSDLEALIAHLSGTASKLHTLTIKNVPHFPASWLKRISRLQELHSLEVRQVTEVMDFNSLLPLGSLVLLKSLQLELDISSTLTTSHLGTMPTGDFLPKLKELDLVGPSAVACDFIRALGTQSLIKLSIHCTTSPTSGPKNGSPILSSLGHRWLESPQELRVQTSTDRIYDLQLISKMRALRHLHISGSVINSLSQFFAMPANTSNFWLHLDTLKLPDTHIVSLNQLRFIAEAAPSLQFATLHLNFYHIPSFYAIKPIRHRLKSMNLTGKGSPLNHDKNGRDKLSHLLDFARYVDLIFPDLVLLNALKEANHWNRVWRVLRFCQNIRTDSKQ
jgi:hypothetical protein